MKILKHICFLIFFLIAFAFCLLSCSMFEQKSNLIASVNKEKSDSKTNNTNLDLAEFNRNKDLWKSQNIQNYRIKLEASGLLRPFPNPILVEVENSKVKNIRSLDQKTNYVKAYDDFNTIDKIFDFIQSELLRNAKKVEVEFDKTNGYPLHVFIDESGGSDDKLRLNIISFEITK